MDEFEEVVSDGEMSDGDVGNDDGVRMKKYSWDKEISLASKGKKAKEKDNGQQRKFKSGTFGE